MDLINAAMLLQGIALAVSGWILREVIKTNGSVRGLLSWKEDHSKQDDERHVENRERITEMHKDNVDKLGQILVAITNRNVTTDTTPRRKR